MTNGSDGHEWLMNLLNDQGAGYRLIEHAPEGRTDLVSAMRGHPVNEAAKCIILLVKIGRKQSRFVLAVIPGDARVDQGKIKQLFRGTFVRFADTALAEELGGTVSGTILPFARDERLTLIVDPAVAASETIYFNAARLDCSVAVKTADYMRIARPRVEPITA